jgi:hypothetical protein
MTIRERAAEAWARRKAEERQAAEVRCKRLAMSIFGIASDEIVFDDFVPEDFAQRHNWESSALCTFNVEGLEFNYFAGAKGAPECLNLIDLCPCGRGTRSLAQILTLADVGWAYEHDWSESKCRDCKRDLKEIATPIKFYDS